ncbi:hypothetical protein MACJ_001930 [Theileria orientalis]|uniref:Uncharacterized protein n=1 Tax=Theileria orientalis TaxID=68886 RepID=A0A976M7N7_THEOR|nr:hypothetical protein MACJ_001930 [Theileria orientalis]
MDSLRPKKVNKRPWIIGGCLTVVIIILIVVLCVTLGSTAESGTSVGVKNVYEAFAYIDNTISTSYKHEDAIRIPLLTELRMFTEKVRVTESMYKAKLEAEKNGQKYDIEIIQKKLASGRFIEKDGKFEMVFEDLTGEVDTSKKHRDHEDSQASKSKLPKTTPDVARSGIPPEGHMPKSGPPADKTPPSHSEPKTETPTDKTPPSHSVPKTEPPTDGTSASHSVPKTEPPTDGTSASHSVPKTETPSDGTSASHSVPKTEPPTDKKPPSHSVPKTETPTDKTPPSHSEQSAGTKDDSQKGTPEDEKSPEQAPPKAPDAPDTKPPSAQGLPETHTPKGTEDKDGAHLQGSAPK